MNASTVLCMMVAAAIGCGPSRPKPPSYPVHREATSATAGLITILGEVRTPVTLLTYRPGLRLVEAIVRAGGFTVFARHSVRLKWRTNAGIQTAFVNVDRIVEGLAPDPELLPGDEVFVEGRYI